MNARGVDVRAQRWWSLGHLLPRLVAAMLLVDMGLRIAMPVWFDFGPTLHRAPGEAFVRNYQAYSEWSYGDLARLGNLPHLRLYRSSSFSTDSHGFRNVEDGKDVRAMLIGDSFAHAGLTNQETLAAQLTRIAGCRVYSTASADPVIQLPSPAAILRLAQQLEMRGGLIIAERLERLGPPRMPDPEDRVSRLLRGIARLSPARRVQVLLGFSPAKLWAEQLFKVLQDDRILPNPYASLVVKKTLWNGDWMLFYEREMKPYEARRRVSVEYWTVLSRELTRAGFRFVVVLVPNKYTVYYRSLADPAQLALRPETFLEETEAALRVAGVPVINLTRALQLQAEKDLAGGSYLYYRDDTHWNSSGIEVGAFQIWRALQATGQSLCS